jgi:predicted dehydrogenase
LEEAKEAAAFIANNGLTVGVHENFRFQPWHREIKTILDAGTLGDVYQCTFRLRPGDGQGPEAYLARQPYFQQMEKFLVRETAIHQIDLFRYFFGEPSGVFARLTRLNPAIAGEDAGMILFDFPGGKRAVFDGNRLVDHVAENTRRTMGEMTIEGSAGTLRLDGNARIWLREHGAQTEVEHVFEWNDHLFGGDCVYATCRAFLDHVIGGRPLENAVAEYVVNREIEDACYRSNAEGRWLALS